MYKNVSFFFKKKNIVEFGFFIKITINLKYWNIKGNKEKNNVNI